MHNIRLTDDGRGGLLCTLTLHENKISSKDVKKGMDSHCMEIHSLNNAFVEQILILSTFQMSKILAHTWGEPGNDAQKITHISDGAICEYSSQEIF